MSINRGMDKEDMVHTYNGILLSHKNKVIPFATTLMNLEIIIPSEASQRKKDILLYCLYVESKKMITNEHIYKTDFQKQTYGYQRGNVI